MCCARCMSMDTESRQDRQLAVCSWPEAGQCIGAAQLRMLVCEADARLTNAALPAPPLAAPGSTEQHLILVLPPRCSSRRQ